MTHTRVVSVMLRIFFIMENYGNAGIEDELYSLHTSLLIEEKFDPQLASVRYLGRAIARLAHSQTLQAVEEILICETDEHRGVRMLSDMVRGAMRQGTRFENALQLLGKLLQGIQEEQSKM